MFKKIALMTSLLLAGCGGGDSSSGAGTGGTSGTGGTPKQYDVTASATANGSITPAKTSVAQGRTAAFTLTPDEGYRIASATGCNGMLNNNVYTTGSVSANCNVTASFTALQFTLSASAGSGGSISPASTVASYNEQVSFQLTPEQGYEVSQISGCGGTLDELRRTYTTAPVTAQCTVDASFERSEYTITSQSSDGGTVSPASIQLPAGARAEFTLSAAAGFRFKQVEGCSGIFEAGKFVIPAVSENCVITASFNDERYIEFPDPELARAVREKLSIGASEPISATLVAEQLVYLSIYNKGISRLDGLQYAANLTALSAGQNNITDISVLTRLPAENTGPKLVLLNLSANKLSQLPDMGLFTNLKDLSLSGNKLTSITALAELANLEDLNLSDNDIDDLSVLSGFSSLNYLSLNGLNVTDDDVRMLNSSTLSTLYLNHTQVSSLEPFVPFTRLHTLSLNYTYIQDLAPVQQFPQLRFFSFYATPVVDLTPLLVSSLPSNATIVVGGCLKLEGFSRAKTVIEQLRSQGKSITHFSNNPLHTTCPDISLIDSLTAQAEINDTGLQLNWQVQSDDSGPWQCELHYDLDSQLPRIPVQILENCHSQQSWLIPELNRDTVVAHLVLDDGITKTKSQVDLGRLRHVNGIADPVLGSYDWLQVVVKSNPYLVPWRDARLRLHILSDTGVAPPQVLVAAKHNGISNALQVTPPSTLPQEKQHGVLSRSYLVNVPAAQLKPGTVFVVTIANQPPQLITPSFAAVNSIDLTLVPFKLGEQVTTLPSLQVVEDSLLKVWPLANINIISRPPFELSTPAAENTTSSMLDELYDLRVVEGSSNYYYGYFTREMNTDHWAGLAYMPGTSAVGQLPDSGVDTTLQHELGHNFGRPHAPCGDPSGPDANYPYAGGSIGSYGVALDLTSLIDPATSEDVMGYCRRNRHVSDYNFELVQDHLTAITSEAVHLRESAAAQTNNASNSSTADIATAASQPALYYRVNISSLSQPLIEQTIQLNQLPALTSSSEFQLMAEYTGEAPAAYAVEKLINGHGEPMPQLSFAVPLYKNGKPLSAWGLYQNKRVLLEHKVVSPGLASPAMAALANSAKITEKGNEVCVDIGSVAVDGANLLLLADQQRYAIAINTKQRAFCRDTTGYPTTGRWQLQLRKNADVQLIELTR